MEKVYNKTQRDKFAWAIAMVDETYEFWSVLTFVKNKMRISHDLKLALAFGKCGLETEEVWVGIVCWLEVCGSGQSGFNGTACRADVS